MRKYAALAIVVTAAVLIAASQLRSIQSVASSMPAEISVTADGVVHAQPDTARLWIGVEGFGPTLVPTDRDADQRLANVVSALRAVGIADQHIRTAGMTVAPQYTTQDGQKQELTGYIARSMLEVETDEIQGLPGLIDSSMAAGANRVDRIQFESSMLDQLRGQARDMAWQAARAQADQLAVRAGTRLDRVTSVDQLMLDDTTTVQPDRATAYSASTGGIPSAVQSGEIEVRTRLHVVWSTQ
jgi:uncharacterized protein YggE